MQSGTLLKDSNSDIPQEEPDTSELDKLAALSAEPPADVYTLQKSFEDLKVLLEKFKAAPTIKASNSADEKSFKTCQAAMDKFYAKGLIAQNLPWQTKNIPKIIWAALAAVKVFESTFKTAKVKPVCGTKSADYCKQVVTPFLRLLAMVQHEEWLIYVCSFKIVKRDLVKEKDNLLALAIEYEKLTEKFFPLAKRHSDSNVTILNVVGQFAVGAESPKSERPQEETRMENK